MMDIKPPPVWFWYLALVCIALVGIAAMSAIIYGLFTPWRDAILGGIVGGILVFLAKKIK